MVDEKILTNQSNKNEKNQPYLTKNHKNTTLYFLLSYLNMKLLKMILMITLKK